MTDLQREDANPKKISDHVPILADQGIQHVAAAVDGGVGLQAKQIVQVGGSPFSIDLRTEAGMTPMADANYTVTIGGEFSADVVVDQSTITKNGFDLLGGAAAEVHHVQIIGRLKGLAPKL